jgi:quercetin dioxygenase-like cupin family protein
MNGRFEDERGVIQDLFSGEPVAVTRITTKGGCVRGNHYHERTDQWTFVISGILEIAEGLGKRMATEGTMVHHRPGVPHAWRALSDSECLVFTKGPRSGENYESDTIRLDEPLLT